AILAHQLWPQARILITGDGKAGEIKVMKEYLLENGIEEDVVVEEDKSTSTWSSFVNLKNVIPNEDFTLIVTNEYHQRRSIATATLMGYRAALFGRDTVTLERRKYYKFREHLSGIKWYLQYLLYKI